MAHHEVQLPSDVERGVTGGPRFLTDVKRLNSGHEKRNIRWEDAKGEWDVAYGLMSMDDQQLGTYVHLVRDFFYARYGRAHSFNFKDWGDFEIGDYQNPTTSNQQIGTGDAAETNFQIFKRYTSGGFTYDRDITKIVPGNAAVLLDGVLQTETTHYTLDDTTGIVSFVSPPGGSVAVQVACEFLVPVRFDIDHLQISVATFQTGAVPAIPIVEVRVA